MGRTKIGWRTPWAFTDEESSSIVYPNPIDSSDVLKIEFGDQIFDKKEVRIIDAKGTVLYAQQGIVADGFLFFSLA